MSVRSSYEIDFSRQIRLPSSNVAMGGTRSSGTLTPQALKAIRVYAGDNAEFVLYDDDGVSNDYERGLGKTARLCWDDKARALTATGDKAIARSIKDLAEIIE